MTQDVIDSHQRVADVQEVAQGEAEVGLAGRVYVMALDEDYRAVEALLPSTVTRSARPW